MSLPRIDDDTASLPLEVGVFGAEPWTNAMREEIERRGATHATDIYGLSEVRGPGVAQESVETKDGLHIWEDHFYPEVVNPLTDEPVPDGQVGELVFTSLTKQAMPILRYRTRDLTRLLPGTARPAMRRMEKVTGRTINASANAGSDAAASGHRGTCLPRAPRTRCGRLAVGRTARCRCRAVPHPWSSR